MNAESLAELAHKTLVIKRNECLKTGGSADTNVYLVESGSLKIFFLNDGEEQIIRFGYAGNLLVSLDSFLTGRPSDIWIEAIKRTVVKVIAKDDFLAYVNRGSEEQNLWRHTLESLVLQQMEREVDLLTTSPRERYERVKQRSPQLFREIPERYIANYLRMSPETLSRLKKS